MNETLKNSIINTKMSNIVANFESYDKATQIAFIFRTLNSIEGYWDDNDPIYSVEVEEKLQRLIGLWFKYDNDQLTVYLDDNLFDDIAADVFTVAARMLYDEVMNIGPNNDITMTVEPANYEIQHVSLFVHPEMLIKW